MTSKKILGSFIWNIVGYCGPALVYFALIPLIVRLFTPAHLSVLGLFWATTAGFVLMDLGLARLSTRLTSIELASKNLLTAATYIKTISIVSGIWGVFLGLLIALPGFFLITHFGEPEGITLGEARSCIILAGLTVPVIMVSELFRGALEAHRRFDLLSITRILVSTGNVGAPYLLYLVYQNIVISVAAIFAVKLIELCVRLALLIYVAPECIKGKFEPLRLKQHTVFCGGLVVSSLINPAFATLDRYFLTTLTGLAQASPYIVLSELTQRFSVIPSALAKVLFPVFSGAKEQDREEISSLYRQCIIRLGLLLFLVLVVMAIGSNLIIYLILDSESNLYTTTFIILIISIVVNGMGSIPFSLLHSYGRTGETAALHFIELIIFLVLLFVLVPKWGMIGAALACLARTSTDTIALLFLANRVIGVVSAERK